jgi:hypothetical protein
MPRSLQWNLHVHLEEVFEDLGVLFAFPAIFQRITSQSRIFYFVKSATNQATAPLVAHGVGRLDLLGRYLNRVVQCR